MSTLRFALCAMLVTGCRGDARRSGHSATAEPPGTAASATWPGSPVDSSIPAPDWGAIQADTIVIFQYTSFVRPLRQLGVSPRDSSDFTPYNVDMEPDIFSFFVERERYLVEPEGQAFHLTAAEALQRFALPLDSGMHIERLSFIRFKGDPVFVYEQTDNEGGSGFVARLDATTTQLKWAVRVPGFNVSFALLDDSDLYVTCIGFVGKLDLSAGKYAWRHDNLYETERFNDFGRPRLSGGTITIPANGRLFVADRRTGRRIKQ